MSWAIKAIRKAFSDKYELIIDILNYAKNGSKF